MSGPPPRSDVDPPPALVVGEALTDVLVRPDGLRRAVPGGSPANVALGLARLGHPVRFATRVGRDHFGGLLRRHLRDSGVLLDAGLLGGAPSFREALRAATDTGRLPSAVTGALARASRAAAITCTRQGADPPTRADLTGRPVYG